MLLNIDNAVQALQIMRFLVGGANLTHAIERFLHAFGYAHLRRTVALKHRLHGLARGEQDQERHRHAPERCNGKRPAEEQRHHEHNRRRDNGTPQLAQHMAVGVFHGLHVTQNGFGKVRQIAAAEERKRQLAQALGNLDALVAAFLVEHAVRVVVLLPVRGEQHHEEHHQPCDERHDIGQLTAAGKMRDKARHGHEQEEHARHNHQVGDGSPQDAAFHTLHALVGQEILLLE